MDVAPSLPPSLSPVGGGVCVVEDEVVEAAAEAAEQRRLAHRVAAVTRRRTGPAVSQPELHVPDTASRSRALVLVADHETGLTGLE